MPDGFVSRLHQSGSSATGRTDSPLPMVVRDRMAERRKSGGTQEHAASALCQRWCGRIVRDSIGQQPRFHLAENGSPQIRALINRRGFQAKAGVAELAGGISFDAAARNGEGLDLGHVRPVFRQGLPSPSGNSQPWQEIVGGHKPPNGALKGANTKLPYEATSSAPSDIPMAAKRRWSERKDQTTGRTCRVNGEAWLKARRDF